jgi:hypothetical protein
MDKTTDGAPSRSQRPSPVQRLAAAAALLGLLAAMIVIALAAFRNVGLLLLALALVAGWTALVLHGT